MKRKQTMTGVTLTLLGGCFWGLCGACAQYLFRTEHVTSNFLVPWRMTLAGALLLGWHLVRSPKQLLGPWKSGRDARQLLLYAIFAWLCANTLILRRSSSPMPGRRRYCNTPHRQCCCWWSAAWSGAGRAG